MVFFRCLVVWILAAMATVLFGVPATFAAFVPPRGNWYTSFARGWARTLLALGGVRRSVLGLARIDPRGSYVFMSNHESMFDILLVLASLPTQLSFLAKNTIFRVPVLGWSMAAAGFIPVDRKNRSSAVASFEQAARRLKRGRSLIIFPEETRSRTGELLPFKRGGVLLALRAGLPIVPVGLSGTREVLPKGSFVFRPGAAVVAVGEPVEVAGRSVREREEIMRAVRERIESLRGEARQALESIKRAS